MEVKYDEEVKTEEENEGTLGPPQRIGALFVRRRRIGGPRRDRVILISLSAFRRLAANRRGRRRQRATERKSREEGVNVGEETSNQGRRSSM